MRCVILGLWRFLSKGTCNLTGILRKGGAGFSARREYRAPAPRAQSRTREAQPTSSGGLFGMDVTGCLFGMSGGFGGRDQLCLKPHSSRGGLRCISLREVEALWRDGDTRITGEVEVGVTLGATKAVAAQAGCVREGLGQRQPVR